MNYIDLYLLPVPEDKIDAYKTQAHTFGEVIIKHGGLDYREFKADPTGDGAETYLKLIPLKDGEILTTAIAEFESKAHRDEVMAKVMEDPQVKAQLNNPEIADMSRMVYGGFDQFVKSKK